MEDIKEVLLVPEHEVISITKALTGLELEKMDSHKWNGKHIVVDVIHTKGFFKASIVCEMEQELFHHIISAMYGGELPPEEEQALYINEYMNIVFGRMVSKINNMTGSVSRLSPPEYCGESVPTYELSDRMNRLTLAYRTNRGLLRFTIQFAFQENGGDRV